MLSAPGLGKWRWCKTKVWLAKKLKYNLYCSTTYRNPKYGDNIVWGSFWWFPSPVLGYSRNTTLQQTQQHNSHLKQKWRNLFLLQNKTFSHHFSLKKTAFLASNDYDPPAQNTRLETNNLKKKKKTSYSCIIAVPNDLNTDSRCHLMILSSYKREKTAFKSVNTKQCKQVLCCFFTDIPEQPELTGYSFSFCTFTAFHWSWTLIATSLILLPWLMRENVWVTPTTVCDCFGFLKNFFFFLSRGRL